MQRSAQDDGSEVRTVKLLTFLIFESDLPSFLARMLYYQWHSAGKSHFFVHIHQIRTTTDIYSRQNIMGFNIGELVIDILAYADDMVLNILHSCCVSLYKQEA